MSKYKDLFEFLSAPVPSVIGGNVPKRIKYSKIEDESEDVMHTKMNYMGGVFDVPRGNMEEKANMDVSKYLKEDISIEDLLDGGTRKTIQPKESIEAEPKEETSEATMEDVDTFLNQELSEALDKFETFLDVAFNINELENVLGEDFKIIVTDPEGDEDIEIEEKENEIIIKGKSKDNKEKEEGEEEVYEEESDVLYEKSEDIDVVEEARKKKGKSKKGTPKKGVERTNWKVAQLMGHFHSVGQNPKGVSNRVLSSIRDPKALWTFLSTLEKHLSRGNYTHFWSTVKPVADTVIGRMVNNRASFRQASTYFWSRLFSALSLFKKSPNRLRKIIEKVFEEPPDTRSRGAWTYNPRAVKRSSEE